MSRTHGVRPLRVIFLSAFVFVLALLAFKFGVEYRNSHERGRFVVSIVEGQLQRFAQFENREAESLAAAAGWPDDSIELQRWLTAEIFRNHDPEGANRSLSGLGRGRSLSPRLLETLNRWDDALRRWAQWRDSMHPKALVDPAMFLLEGRLRYAEASGLQRTGRAYDATPLYLWSVESLAAFITREPLSPDVPEALFLLGEVLVRLRNGLPERDRSDRLLNLCAETYPESVWAHRAWEFRKDLSGNDT